MNNKQAVCEHIVKYGFLGGREEDTSKVSGQGVALAALKGRTLKQHSLTGLLLRCVTPRFWIQTRPRDIQTVDGFLLSRTVSVVPTKTYY